MKKRTLALIGAGERGAHCYAPYALKYPQEVSFVAVAEPDAKRREAFARAHGIAPQHCYENDEALLGSNVEVDGVIIANQDQQHHAPALKALRRGWHVLCEKPMAETLEKCKEMVEAAEQNNRLLMIGHVLRYTPFFAAIKQQLDAGIIGDVQAVHHIENIGNWHFTHSFVRGSWRNSAISTPMIVAKCSHDMDILNYLLGKRCLKVSSVGSLSYFKSDNAPQGAAKRCPDCIHQKNCAFSYYHYFEARDTYLPFRSILEHRSSNGIQAQMNDSPYARCVYFCDNDVADHQAVQMEYEDGIVVSFTASAFTYDISRQIKIMGTRGEIEGRLEDHALYTRDFASGAVNRLEVYAPQTNHAGGDERIMADFCAALHAPDAYPQFGARLSLAGHVMAFGAEYSRMHGGIPVAIVDGGFTHSIENSALGKS